jgi:hypothetical protein
MGVYAPAQAPEGVKKALRDHMEQEIADAALAADKNQTANATKVTSTATEAHMKQLSLSEAFKNSENSEVRTCACPHVESRACPHINSCACPHIRCARCPTASSSNRLSCQQCDKALARLFIDAGWSFNSIDNPRFKEALDAFRATSRAYKLPDRKKLSGILLKDEFARRREALKAELKEAEAQGGYTLVTDGLTYQKRPFSNYVAVLPTSGSLVADVVDCTDQMDTEGCKDAS